MKLPIPLPSIVCGSEIVGLVDVLQHTPLAVMVDPPSELIVPPDVADIVVISDTPAVEIVGKVVKEVNTSSLPYSVPALFVA